jgi:hypothetical protein
MPADNLDTLIHQHVADGTVHLPALANATNP